MKGKGIVAVGSFGMDLDLQVVENMLAVRMLIFEINFSDMLGAGTVKG